MILLTYDNFLFKNSSGSKIKLHIKFLNQGDTSLNFTMHAQFKSRSFSLKNVCFVYYNAERFKEVLIHKNKMFTENENRLMGQCEI